MHIVGFEPTLSFERKWIMSPVLSTTQPYMLTSTFVEITYFKNLIEIIGLFQIVFSSEQGKFVSKE